MRINAGLRVPLTVIGGFLGAGKTTLVNALLAAPGRARLAVLVNDFGAVNIDAALISARGSDTIALSNGCVCCAMGDDLGLGIARVLARRPAPDHIVVEASGVADPWRIAEIALIDPDLYLAGVVVLADASRLTGLLDDRLVGDVVRRQLSVADLLLLTKPDLVPEAQLGSLAAVLAQLAPRAGLMPVSQGRAPDSLVLGEMAVGGARGGAGTSRTAYHGAVFDSVTLYPHRVLDEPTLRQALDGLPDGVLRAKGLLRDHGPAHQAWLVQRVGRRLRLSHMPMPPEATEALVLIGTSGIAEATEAMRAIGVLAAPPHPRIRLSGGPIQHERHPP